MTVKTVMTEKRQKNSGKCRCSFCDRILASRACPLPRGGAASFSSTARWAVRDAATGGVASPTGLRRYLPPQRVGGWVHSKSRHPEPPLSLRRVEGSPHYNKVMVRQAHHDVIENALMVTRRTPREGAKETPQSPAVTAPLKGEPRAGYRAPREVERKGGTSCHFERSEAESRNLGKEEGRSTKKQLPEGSRFRNLIICRNARSPQSRWVSATRRR